MWKCRAALAALFFSCAASAQAQATVNCLKLPPLKMPFGMSWPKAAKFHADVEPAEQHAGPLKVSVIHSSFPEQGTEYLVQHLRAGRWTCADKPGAARPLAQQWEYVPGSRTQFSQPRVTLQRFFEMVKDVPGTRVDFNLDDMGCPMAVRWQSFQPVAANRARLLYRTASPQHQALLQWLASLELDAPEAQQRALIGETLEIRIPCGRINLAPPAPAASAAG